MTTRKHISHRHRILAYFAFQSDCKHFYPFIISWLSYSKQSLVLSQSQSQHQHQQEHNQYHQYRPDQVLVRYRLIEISIRHSSLYTIYYALRGRMVLGGWGMGDSGWLAAVDNDSQRRSAILLWGWWWWWWWDWMTASAEGECTIDLPHTLFLSLSFWVQLPLLQETRFEWNWYRNRR